MLDKAKQLYKENRGNLWHHLVSTSQLAGDKVELVPNLISLFTQLDEIPLVALDDAFGASGREAWAIAQADLIFTFKCLGCEVSLQPKDLKTLRRLKRVLHTACQSKVGELVSADLVCPPCTKVRLELRSEQYRLSRIRLQARVAQMNNKMSYADYLEQAEWKSTRAIVLARAEYKCEMCDEADEPLHVHHRRYGRRGCERLQDLKALCRTCHELFHGIEQQDAS